MFVFPRPLVRNSLLILITLVVLFCIKDSLFELLVGITALTGETANQHASTKKPASERNVTKRELMLVQMLFRHGHRAPFMLYPYDPNSMLDWKEGMGMLTQSCLPTPVAKVRYCLINHIPRNKMFHFIVQKLISDFPLKSFPHRLAYLKLLERTRMPLRRNRRQYEQLTDFDRGRIIGLREAGWSNRRIGRHLGRSDMVVARCWQQWITEGRVYRRGGSGRPRNTNDREDRAIRRVATSAPTTSLASIQRHLPPSRHPVPSRETIRRRLTEVGLRSRRPLRRLPLTPHHRQCRLDFCRPRATWSVTDWRRVIFSDESRFSLSPDDHRTRVWRRTGQRSDPAFIVERHTAISQGVTVWGAISWDTRSSLVVLQGTLTARRYVDDILTPIVLPMLSSRPGAIYQQDNARPHTA
ncbi:HTH_Tnp_Tc3_2 domain-containing protein [Trichonephila clavipes]|nr:HTH_Tnp_Tc3_2 domain-containing protein [Trichonephila clavipes]